MNRIYYLAPILALCLCAPVHSQTQNMTMLTAEPGYEWWTGTFTTSPGPWQLTHRKIADGSWSNVLTMTTGGNLGIGTTNPGSYKLAVEGTIGARDVMVTNTVWSDYVFRPGYRLRPLSEVSQYIQANGHLPEIPTEAEVKEKGVSLGVMQTKLLAKVEELTLHLIQQEKENKDLRERLSQLEPV
jgi:hypothetical protein